MRDYGAGWLEPLGARWMRRFHNAGDATIVATRELRDFLAGARFANPVCVARAVDGALFHPGKRDRDLRAQWGSLAAKKIVPASAGHLPDHGALFVGLVFGVILIVGGLTFFPALALGPLVEHLAMTPAISSEERGYLTMELRALRKRRRARLDRPGISCPAIGATPSSKLDPRAHGQQPGDVRGRGRRGADHGALRARLSPAAASASRSRSSSGCGSRCCSPTSPRRWPKAAARRRPTSLRERAPRRQAKLLHGRRPQTYELVPGTDLQGRRRRAGRGRRHHPLRRRGHRRRRLGQRGGDHRRIGARHPRERRRPLGRHRRHAGAVRLDQGAHHRRSRARPSSTA